MKDYTVVAAVVVKNKEVLCTQRKQSKYDYISFKWEFPGGKIEEGESDKQALSREIREELNIEIEIGEKLLTVTHEYLDFKLTMHAYMCRPLEGELLLNEHVAFKWLTKNQLPELDWAAADLPIVKKLTSDKNL